MGSGARLTRGALSENETCKVAPASACFYIDSGSGRGHASCSLRPRTNWFNMMKPAKPTNGHHPEPVNQKVANIEDTVSTQCRFLRKIYRKTHYLTNGNRNESVMLSGWRWTVDLCQNSHKKSTERIKRCPSKMTLDLRLIFLHLEYKFILMNAKLLMFCKMINNSTLDLQLVIFI